METISKILAKFAHDLRNPLSGIKGQADLLEYRLSDRPDLLRKVDQINSAADDIEKMIQDLQNRSRQQDIDSYEVLSLLHEIQQEMDTLLISNETQEPELYVNYPRQLLFQTIMTLAASEPGHKKIILANVQENVMMSLIRGDGQPLFFIELKRGNQ